MLEIDRLRTIPLLASLNDAELMAFNKLSSRVSFRGGQTIYRLGDTDCTLFILLCGKVRILTTDRYGKQVVLGHIQPTEVFGETATSPAETYSATAIALTDVEAIQLVQANLRYLFSVKPAAALMLMASLEQRLRKVTTTLSHSRSSPQKK